MFAVVFIPNFSLQAALRHEPDLVSRAVALTDPESPKLGIIQFTSMARDAGVHEGMSASQAMGRCADLVIKSRSPAQEQSATDILIQTAYAFSPFIESTAPGVCRMDLRGLRVVENESAMQKWAGEITKSLAQFHLDARIGFAATPNLALLGAYYSLVVSNPVEFISNLPIEMLGLPAETLETLIRWGIGTAGALLALGKDALAERLGPEVIEVFERLSPNFVRPLKIASLPETFAEQMEFQNEIETLEPLLFVSRRFVEQLSRRIELLYLVVAELHLKLGLSSGAAYESVFKVPSPTGNPEILFRMLHTHLENVRTDASIISLCLSARPGLPQAHQFGLFETTLRNPNQFAETLARLEALCGPDRVGTSVLETTLRPDSFRIKPADFSGAERERSRKVGRAVPSASRSSRRSCGIHTTETIPGALRIARPTFTNEPRGLQLRRFRPPLAARIEFKERRPVLVRSAVCNGTIVDRRGPFLTSGNWWDDGRWWREEWDVQMADGRMYRIFRTAPITSSPPSSPLGEEREKTLLRVGDECFVEGVYD